MRSLPMIGRVRLNHATNYSELPGQIRGVALFWGSGKAVVRYYSFGDSRRFETRRLKKRI